MDGEHQAREKMAFGEDVQGIRQSVQQLTRSTLVPEDMHSVGSALPRFPSVCAPKNVTKQKEKHEETVYGTLGTHTVSHSQKKKSVR